MKKTFVSVKNAGDRPDDTYKKAVEKIRADAVCPFCPDNLARYHKKPIIKTGRYWILTANMYPYRGARHHLLMVYKKHVEHLSEVAPRAWSELLKLTQAEAGKRAIAGGMFYMRFGDTSHTGASVAHLHANLVSPDIRGKNRKPVTVRVG